MKNKVLMKWVVIVYVFGISVAPVLAIGQDQKMNYAKVNLGAYNPTDQLDDDNYDLGVNFSLSYGHYLTPYLSVEIGLDSFYSENDYSGTNSRAGTYDQDNVMIGNGLTFTVKSIHPVKQARLYVGAGFGLYAATLDTEIDSSRLGDLDKNESDVVAGVHWLVGIDADISDRWFINIEGKYRIIDDVDINETVASIPVAYNGDLDGISVTTGFGFRF